MNESEAAAQRDALQKLYQEHCAQGRHHETQRAAVTSALIAIAAGILGLIAVDHEVARRDIPLAALLFLLGLFGGVFSFKHYERWEMHMQRARVYRDALDRMLADQGILARLKNDADKQHGRKYPRLKRLRLHLLWVGLNVGIAVIGGFVLYCACANGK